MKQALTTRTVCVGGSVLIGSGHPIVVQTMCNTRTADVESTVAQCRRLSDAGAQLIRITVPSLSDVQALERIHATLRSEGIQVPLVADIHFSAEIAMAVVPVVEKMIAQEPLPAPKMVMDPEVKDFYQFTRYSFTLEDYQFQPFTDAIPVAV